MHRSRPGRTRRQSVEPEPAVENRIREGLIGSRPMAVLAPQVRPDPLLDEPPESAEVARAVLEMEVPRPPADDAIDRGDECRRGQRQVVPAGEGLHFVTESLAGVGGWTD